MSRLSEKKRLSHPKTQLFSPAIWKIYFGEQGLSHVQLQLMRNPLNVVSDAENEIKSKEQLKNWLCVLVGHSGASIEELGSKAASLHLPLSIIIAGALSCNRLDILAQYDKKVLRKNAQDDYLFHAVCGGSIGLLIWLKQTYNRMTFQKMLRDGYHMAFSQACKNGHLEILKWLVTQSPNRFQSMILANNTRAFEKAAKNGHLDILKWFVAEAPKLLQPTTERYYLILKVVKKGHLETLKWLAKQQNPEQFQRMIAEKNYWAFIHAADNGHLDILIWLSKQAPQQLQAMIAAENYYAFSGASYNGHLDILNWLAAKAPEQLQAMIGAGNYGAFIGAARNGHIDILNWLEEKVPEQLQAMIAANNYSAFRLAAGGNHLDTLNWLEEKAPDQLPAMIAADYYFAFRYAPDNKKRLYLSYFNVFAYAEMHEREYGEAYVRPFIQEKLSVLHAQCRALEAANPHAVFDLTAPNEAPLCFYILRNIIRQNNPLLLDELRFLMGTPAVKALLHTAVTPQQPNELLRLALTVGNAAAAEVLLTIPAVRSLAEANNFYRTERRGELDLHRLAQDRESSMTALSTLEQQRLKRVIDHYQPAGVPNVMDRLRETLTARYDENPAIIVRDDGSTLTLPMRWDDFIAVRSTLSPTEDTRALDAYYRHKDHTAYRYLSKPNPWMHGDASYVEVNPLRPTERWSRFQEYQPVIAMLYMAAMDTEILGIDGFTVETRLTHFIDELAHIGRAHNWDRTRLVMDDAGHEIMEEYDDGEGDKPSCFSGVKRRLFQSVLDHPLLQILTQSMLDQEIQGFVREHFQSKINDRNRQALEQEFDEQLLMGSEDLPLFKTLDISLAQQDTFIQALQKKYGEQFDAKFQAHVHQRLSLKTEAFTYACHAAKFAGEISLSDLVHDCIKAQLKKDLQGYIDSLQADKRAEHYYFKGKNREINCLLAQKLLLELEDGTPISELFQQIKEKRAHLQTKFPSHPHKQFPISAALNNIIKRGQAWQKSILTSVSRMEASPEALPEKPSIFPARAALKAELLAYTKQNCPFRVRFFLQHHQATNRDINQRLAKKLMTLLDDSSQSLSCIFKQWPSIRQAAINDYKQVHQGKEPFFRGLRSETLKDIIARGITSSDDNVSGFLLGK